MASNDNYEAHLKTMIEAGEPFLVLSSTNLINLCLVGSELVKQGYVPHSNFIATPVADVSSPTFTRLAYIQAFYKPEAIK
jgi:hypothetical protein